MTSPSRRYTTAGTSAPGTAGFKRAASARAARTRSPVTLPPHTRLMKPATASDTASVTGATSTTGFTSGGGIVARKSLVPLLREGCVQANLLGQGGSFPTLIPLENSAEAHGQKTVAVSRVPERRSLGENNDGEEKEQRPPQTVRQSQRAQHDPVEIKLENINEERRRSDLT